MATKIESAEAVVVSGAGLVGTEVAGEIKSKHPSKSVTLVGNLSGMSSKLGKKTEKALLKLGVVRLPGRTSGEPVAGKLSLTEGEPIACDLLLECAGFVYDPSPFEAHLSTALTSRGQLQTEPSLRVSGTSSVFAVGDIVHVPEGCYAPASGFGKCAAQAAVVVPNVLATLKKKPGPLKQYKWATKPDLVPAMSAFGPTNAVADIGLTLMPSWLEDLLARKFKAKSFFMAAKMGPTFGMGGKGGW